MRLNSRERALLVEVNEIVAHISSVDRCPGAGEGAEVRPRLSHEVASRPPRVHREIQEDSLFSQRALPVARLTRGARFARKEDARCKMHRGR